MSDPEQAGDVSLSLDEALEMLAVLEDARDHMIDNGHRAASAPPPRSCWALIHAREIDYVMREGIAHVPESAIEEYRASES